MQKHQKYNESSPFLRRWVKTGVTYSVFLLNKLQVLQQQQGYRSNQSSKTGVVIDGMKNLFVLFLLLAFSVWLGLMVQSDPGYALFAYHQWTLETPLWFVAGCWLVSLILFYVIFKLIHSGFFITQKITTWRYKSQVKEAAQKTSKGLIALAEGQWAQAENFLLASAKKNKAPLINYLAAALAAQKQGKYKHRDGYLRLAHDSTPLAEVAIGLTQAQLQLDKKQYEQALATLCRLWQLAPHHEYVLRLLQSLYVKLGDWQRLGALLPELRKSKFFSRDEYEALEQKTYVGLLSSMGHSADWSGVMKVWDAMPRRLRKNPQLVKIYARYLLQFDEQQKAYLLLEATLSKVWDPSLLKLYAEVQADNAQKQLSVAEAWLKTHRTDPDLFYCLGILSKRLKLWGKTREYFQASIVLKPQMHVSSELGQLLELLEEKEQALACYRAAVLHGSQSET